MIGEVRTRGIGGGGDEFLELYNPTNGPIVLDTSWSVEGRSHTSKSYTVKWLGFGETIGPLGHYLLTGEGYVQSPSGDAQLLSGVTDAGSIRLVHSGATIDSVCYYFSVTSFTALVTDKTFDCEGEPFNNGPHKDSGTGKSNTDVSFERLPADFSGNCVDTGDSKDDFVIQAPSTPHNALGQASN